MFRESIRTGNYAFESIGENALRTIYSKDQINENIPL